MQANANDERSCIVKDFREKLTFREKWHNKDYKMRICQSLGICASFIALGVNSGQIGPTLLDLQILTGTDLVTASTFVSAGSAGGMSGTILCGFMYGKTNPDLLIFLAVLMEGIAAIVTPFCSYYGLMFFIRYTTFLFGGILNACGNASIIRLWSTEGKQWIQFLHFCCALGGVLAPVYSAPFLAPNNRVDQEISELNKTAIFMMNSSSGFLRNDTQSITRQESNVKYAFMISGVFTILMSLPLLLLYLQNRERIHEHEHAGKKQQRQLPQGIMVMTLFILCMFYMNYIFMEGSFIAFLMVFLVSEFEYVPKQVGTFALALFWTFFATGRFLMVFISKALSPVQMLAISIAFIIVAFTSFLIMAEIGFVNALIGLSALVGLSLSGVYAAALSWFEAEILRITGPVAGVLAMFCCLANVINPLIFGHLMQEVSNMWFCYLLLGGAIVFAFYFTAILVYSRWYLNQRFKASGPGD